MPVARPGQRSLATTSTHRGFRSASSPSRATGSSRAGLSSTPARPPRPAVRRQRARARQRRRRGRAGRGRAPGRSRPRASARRRTCAPTPRRRPALASSRSLPSTHATSDGGAIEQGQWTLGPTSSTGWRTRASTSSLTLPLTEAPRALRAEVAMTSNAPSLPSTWAAMDLAGTSSSRTSIDRSSTPRPRASSRSSSGVPGSSGEAMVTTCTGSPARAPSRPRDSQRSLVRPGEIHRGDDRREHHTQRAERDRPRPGTFVPGRVAAPDDDGAMTTDRLGAEILETNTCWELLRANEVGRLAVSITDHPDIFPVNYVVDRGSVVFRTAEGTKLAAAVLGPGRRLRGRRLRPRRRGRLERRDQGRRGRDRADAGRLRRAGPAAVPVARLPKHRFVRIEPRDISGRRFHVTDHVSAGPPRVDTPRAREE